MHLSSTYLLNAFLTISLLFTPLFISGCSDAPEQTLRLGTNIWPGYEPLYLARERGHLDEEKVRLVELSSSSQVLQAYRNNLIDAAALTLDEVLLLLDSGESPKIILVMDISNGGDAIIGQPEITKFKDILGKRVGVENNALGAYVIHRALEIYGIDKNAVKIIPLDINEQENAFKMRKVDAVVTFDPVRSRLLKANANLLFDSRRLPGEIVDVLIVRNTFLTNQPHTTSYLLNAWYRSLAYMKRNPREAAQILGTRMKLNVQDTLSAYNELILPDKVQNQQMLSNANELGAKPKLLSTALKLSTVMKKTNLLQNTLNPEQLFPTINVDQISNE